MNNDLIDKLKEAGMEEAKVRLMNTIDQSAMLKTLDRLRFEEHQEREQRTALTTGLADAAERVRSRERDELLAENIDRHNRLKTHDEKMRQMVRFNSQELRELEYKLRTAYVGQGLRAQLKQREAEKLQEKVCFKLFVLRRYIIVFEFVV